MAPMCKTQYPVRFLAVDIKTTRTIRDQAFSVPNFVRLARMSEKSYELLGKKFIEYASVNFNDFERQKQRGSTAMDYNAADDKDKINRVMMEVKPLLEASGK